MPKIKIENIIYQCKWCMIEFTRPEPFKKHVKSAHQTSIVVCSSCPMYFEDLGKLFLHARQVHNSGRKEHSPKKNKCTFPNCNYQTNNGGLFRHHMRSHLNFKPFECDICHKRFTQKSNMKTHYNRHKKNNYKFKCEPCEKEFNSHDTYLSHLETREHYLGTYVINIIVQYRCMVCNLEFNNTEEISGHISECQIPGVEAVECKLCFAKLTYDIELIEAHTKSHKCEFVCPFCDTETYFNDKTKFNFHLTKVHKEFVARRPVCRYCEASFVNEEERRKHIEEEHQNLINKHKSRDFMGRIACTFEGCNFTTNSEIYFQKHLTLHYGKFDVDLLYKKDALVKNEETENDVNISLPRKRGRPRLCDSIVLANESIVSSDGPSESSEMKRKRGRPRKSETPRESEVQEKKRGRPRKSNDRSTGNLSKYAFKTEDVDPDINNDQILYTIDGLDLDPNNLLYFDELCDDMLVDN